MKDADGTPKRNRTKITVTRSAKRLIKRNSIESAYRRTDNVRWLGNGRFGHDSSDRYYVDDYGNLIADEPAAVHEDCDHLPSAYRRRSGDARIPADDQQPPPGRQVRKHR